MSERTPSQRSTASSGETPDTEWDDGDSGEEDFAEILVERVAHPLWLIARALARLANVPFSELEQEDEDGSEFSLARSRRSSATSGHGEGED